MSMFSTESFPRSTRTRAGSIASPHPARPISKRAGALAFAAAAALAVLGLDLATAPKADAAFIVTIEQVGANVVVTGSGTIDLSGLAPYGGYGDFGAAIAPSQGTITIGSTNFDAVNLYTGFNGPSIFGPGGVTVASSGSGDKVAIAELSNQLAVPSGYVSGSALTDSSTYDNTTLAALGVTDGTYTWTWGSGADVDSFTLDIGPLAVPEPASFALLGAGLIGLAFTLRRRATP